MMKSPSAPRPNKDAWAGIADILLQTQNDECHVHPYKFNWLQPSLLQTLSEVAPASPPYTKHNCTAPRTIAHFNIVRQPPPGAGPVGPLIQT